MQVVTVQAILVHCRSPQFPDHTQQTLEKLFTFHLALPVQAAPVQIHIGGVVLGIVSPEGLNLEQVNHEEMENHMRVDLKVEDVIRALLVRGARAVQLADH
jgi:hypothetical protein